jgi:ATP-dependent RNA helicase DeaD
MLDMGFREELEEILDATPRERRTLLFSATMPRPIVALARRYQQNALRIETLGENEAHQDIAYQALAVSPTDVENAVVNLLRLHEAETAILFCATREAVRRLHASLVERGFHAVALSGEHSQNERNQALQALRDRRARVCVATDVAARGIDLPSVSLVVHVELPRDAEALQHRSGRTGRAGRKGTAVLIVPFQRRKRVEAMLRGARIAAEWISAPSAAEIRAKDRERLLETASAPLELDEDEAELARQLVDKLPAEAIAGALIRALRTDMPAPEELVGSDSRGPDRGGEREDRPGFESASWFRLNAGRRHNADPRWLLPLICRYGHVNRTEIGAIRVAANESFFQVSERATPGFVKALRRATVAPEDQGLVIELAEPARKPSAYRPERAHERPPPGKKPRHPKRG